MRAAALLGLFAVVGFALVAVAGPGKKPASQPQGKALNPVQVEMRLLRDAMRDAVDAISNGDVRKLPKQLHAVHMASGDTAGAIEAGKYKLHGDSSPARVKAFIALDQDFHREMIKMVKAAKKNDVTTTAAQFGVLMNRCHGCHAQYRPTPNDR